MLRASTVVGFLILSTSNLLVSASMPISAPDLSIERRPVTLPGSPIHLGVSPDGSLMAAAVADHHLLIIESASGKVLRELNSAGNFCMGLKFANDGGLLLCTTGTGLFNSTDQYFEVWRCKDGRRIFSNRPGEAPKFPHADDLSRAWGGDLSPDGTKLVICANSGSVYAVDLAAGADTRIATLSNLGIIGEIHFSPDGKRLACLAPDFTGDSGGKLYVVRSDDYRVEHPYEMQQRRFAAIKYDGRIILAESRAGETDRRLIEADSGKMLIDGMFTPGTVTFVGFLCNDSRFAVLTTDQLRIWGLATGAIAMTIEARNFQVAACGGCCMALAGHDGTLRVICFDGRN